MYKLASVNAEEGGKVVRGRAEIDTRAPFRSVKEAVMLFGDRFGEIYGNKLKEIAAAGEANENGRVRSQLEILTTELEEAQRNLQKAKEENKIMAYCINSLRNELDLARRELYNYIKAKEHFQKHPTIDRRHHDHPEIKEDVKLIENATEEFETRKEEDKYQKKRYVKFASPPSLAQVIVNKDEVRAETMRSAASNSVRSNKMNKKKPLMGWLFAKNKVLQAQGSPRSG